MMLGKEGGRGRVSRLLDKAGYGKTAAVKAAEGGSSEHHKDLQRALSSVEKEVHGNAPKARLDRKPRANGGPLTAKRRNALPTSSFAEPKERKYPINDPNHARNALTRVSQNGSSEEKAKVRSAVHRKYPGIGKKKD